MDNQLNSGILSTLKFGETLLVSAKRVKNGKLQLEFAEVTNTPKDGLVNIVGMLNASDSRFGSKARRSWVTVEAKEATQYFGADFGEAGAWYMTEKGEILDLNILNPTMNGVRCRIIIKETTEGNDWQNDNIETSAKRKGKDGDYITCEGEFIFSNSIVTLTDVEDTTSLHTLLVADVEEKRATPKLAQVEAGAELGAL